MPQTSFALMTNVGRAREAAALANGTTINITQIAIGDGATIPSGGETALYNEVARKAISGHGTVTGATNVAYFDAYLAAADGPYTIREAGLYDDTGALIAIAHYDPAISKPVPSSGQTVEGTIRLEVAFSNVASIVITVDPSFAVALQRLSRLPWIPVLSMTTTAPPSSPVVGDCYLIPTGATGSWSGNTGKISEYTTAGWAMISAPDGHGISLPDGRVFLKQSGAYTEKLALDSQSGKWAFAVAGGTASALTATLTPAPLALTVGMSFRLQIAATNTGAATLNLNGLGAKAIKRPSGDALRPTDLLAGTSVVFTYDGTAFRADRLAEKKIGSFTILDSIQINADVAAFDWNLVDGYDFFRLSCFMRSSVQSTQLRISRDGGANFLAGSTDYVSGYSSWVSTSTYGGTPYYQASGMSFSEVFNLDANGYSTLTGLFHRGAADIKPQISGTALGASSGIGFRPSLFQGRAATVGACNAIRILPVDGSLIKAGSVIVLEGMVF